MDLSQEQWQQQLQNDANAVILDVRTDEEWEDGMIPGAMHIDIHRGQGFIDEVSSLDRSKNYYVYCKAGSRSAHACALMKQLGFMNTYNLVGGITQWRGEVGHPE